MRHHSFRHLWSLFGLLLFWGCNSDQGSQSGSARHYSLGLSVDGVGYAIPANNLFGDTIHTANSGKPYDAKGLIQSENYVYFYSQPEKKFFQYTIDPRGTLTEKSGIPVAGYVSEQAFSQNLLDKNTILIMDPVKWGEPEVKWVTISIPDFKISGSGTYQLPYMEQTHDMAWKSSIGRAILHAGKVIMGTAYFDFQNNFASGAHVVVFDYPGMTNPRLVSTNLISAEVGAVSTNSFVKSGSGDLYLAACRGAVLGTITDNKVYGGVLRIKKDQTSFDESYLFDLSAVLKQPANILHLDALNGDEAMAVLVDDTKMKGCADIANDHYIFARLELPSKKIQKYNVPKSDARVARMPLITDSRYTSFLKSHANNTVHILEIDTKGGPDAFRKGAVIEGKNVLGYGIIAHR
ncbi:MAG TPA: hypothetical protein VGN64_02745 [Dyadobacter sp.]|nr:hypothetical protein [Dyadobacter sp.]